MDPYIERPELWPDFHDSFVAAIRGALQPLLRPRYAALTQERLYVTRSQRPIYPDVSVLRTKGKSKQSNGAVALLEPDTPVYFELMEEIREPFVTIVEPARGNRVIAALEVLSPKNKTPGEGHDDYYKKREELWSAGVHTVEIDLLRDGTTSVGVAVEQLESLRPWHYLVAVTRRGKHRRQEVYPVPLRQRLPRIAIPLADGDADVTLDLQSAFTRCWDEGPYPELLEYTKAPPGVLGREDKAWCRACVRRRG
jgi:hypothetical protein